MLGGLLALFSLLVGVMPAAAHPNDEANVYHYLWFEARPGKLELQHATIAGGLVSQAVWSQMDPDGDRELSPQEQRDYARQLAGNLFLTVEGKKVRWTLEEWEFPTHTEFFSGSLPAVKLRLTANLPRKSQGGPTFQVEDQTYPQFTGVFPEPVVRPDRLSVRDLVVTEDGRRTQVTLGPAGMPSVTTGRSSSEAPNPDAESSTAPGNAPRLPGLELESTAPLGSGSAVAPGAPQVQGTDLQSVPLFKERGQVLYARPGEKHDDHADALKGFLGKNLTPGLLVVALGVALLAGAAHALTPGHGKAMVGAYLVGSRGTIRDAVVLGLVVTLTHTSSVYLLGFLCLWLTSRIQAEVVGQWLSVGSGVLLLGMGFWLFQRGLLAYHGLKPLPGHSHGPGGHSHGWGPGASAVGSGEGHGHAHEHMHAAEHTHSRAPEHAHSHSHATPAHSHSQAHARSEAHSHTHDHGHTHDRGHTHAADHSHTHTDSSFPSDTVPLPQDWGQGGRAGVADHSHTHGNPTDPSGSTVPPLTHYATRNTDHAPHPQDWGAGGRDRQPPSDSPLDDYRGTPPADLAPAPGRWGIIGLGVAGGMVPCFDALAILIAAVNLNNLPLGMLIIAAFSLGMAAVLVAIGVLMVTAKSMMKRFTGNGPWIRALPAVSGGILFLLGSWLTFRALVEAGVLRVG